MYGHSRFSAYSSHAQCYTHTHSYLNSSNENPRTLIGMVVVEASPAVCRGPDGKAGGTARVSCETGLLNGPVRLFPLYAATSIK